MTDSAPHDPDQLASDLVDGLLPPAEAARWRADPDVAARVARIEALRRALRSPLGAGAAREAPAPAPGAIDRMVAAAVAAASVPAPRADRPLHAVPPPPPPGPPSWAGSPATSGPSPSHRSRSRSAAPWLAAVAAAAVAVVAFAGLVSQGGDVSDDMATSSADDAGSGAAESAPQDAGGADDRDTTTSPFADEDESSGDAEVSTEADGDGAGGSLSSLGSVESPEALADEVRADLAAGDPVPPSAAFPEEPGPDCPGLRPEGDPARGTVTYVADAVYQGVGVRVHVYEQDGARQLVATDPSCDDVVDVPFDA